MKNIIQDYAWGSKEYLQKLTKTASDGPLAELWMGVHPRGESQVEIENGIWEPLSEMIKSHPDLTIGEYLNKKFGNLPFLFKLLAAGEPLSIQAHPSKAQAEEGFKREEAAGVPIDAFNRNYKDDNHKPEIVCAMTPYWAMKGFRTPEEIRKNFLSWLPDEAAGLLFPDENGENKEQLKTFFQALMDLKNPLKKKYSGKGDKLE